MTSKEVEALPDYPPPILNHAYGKTLRCLHRDKHIMDGPEERVRQRVLSWLMNDQSWPPHRIKIERTYSFATGPRQRGRADIVLYDDNHKECVVIECKAPGVPLDEGVFRQARSYAVKTPCQTIWLTDGDVNVFYTKNAGKWSRRSAATLGIVGSAPAPIPSFPNLDDRNAVERYWRQFDAQGLGDLLEPRHSSTLHFALSVHKIIFDLRPKLPFSHEGVHVLEDRGVRYHSFSNPSGGRWTGLYRTFLVATEGRVEAASIGLQRSSFPKYDDVLLCVGFLKERRTHHALQLHSFNCEVRKTGNWDVWHKGTMGGSSLPISKVVEAIEEANALHLLGPQQGEPPRTRHRLAKRINIGTLPAAQKITWSNTRQFLANLLHYSVLRTNLREAESS